MDRLRSRILAAMGLAAVGCPAGEAAVGPPPKATETPLDAAATGVPVDSAPIRADASAGDANVSPVASAPSVVDAGRAPDGGRADASATSATIAAYEVTYPLPASQVQWCTKTGQALCLDRRDVIPPTTGRPQPPSTRFPLCPSQLAVECVCHGRDCQNPPGDPKCAAALSEAITAQQQARHAGVCCYPQEVYCGLPGEGRPLRSATGTTVARTETRSDWSARAPSVDMTVTARGALAAHWARAAAAEHASVAAFARTALELLALGAPPALLAAVHRAALDEIDHARVSYALASAYGGAPVGPSALVLPEARPAAAMLLARETIVDGCFGETVGALLLRVVAERVDPGARAAVERIVDDEMAHAELAFAILAWLVRTASTAERAALRDVARQATVAVVPTPYFAETEGRAIADEAITKVVRPCLDRLFAA